MVSLLLSASTSTASPLLDRIWRDVASAEASGVRGTPTFVAGDKRHTGPFDARSLIDALERSATAE